MTAGFDAQSSVRSVLANPAARTVFQRALPGLANSPMTQFFSSMPLRVVVERDADMREDTARLEAFWAELAAIPDDSPPRVDPVIGTPSADYEPADVPRASAPLRLPASAECNAPVELVLDGPAHGNPYVDVELEATFTSPGGDTVRVGGFYDGEGRYLVRLLPETAGEWSFRTRSNARSLDAVEGTVDVLPSEHPGAVRVADQFHFRHQDGTRYAPFGTTVYAWVHQPDELQEQTLRSLQNSPFNKLRLCVFPKSYLYNTEEPARFPFVRDQQGGFDATRFDPEFFRTLDRRIAQLGDAGIQADLILFHPYDRWGFSDLGRAVDEHYVRYVVRRYAAYPHVWWSMANEYDLVWSKTQDDWERLAGVVLENDHARHLLGIHNCFGFYDHSRPWITHASVQRVDVYRTAENTDQWREQWGKPVVVDECGYEGDLDQGWGNLTGEEMTRRFWEGAVRGGYVQHGETYYSEDDVIWWSKGGALRGTSPDRIRFLAGIVAEAPDGVLDPLPSEWDAPWGGVAGEYVVIYFGFSRPRFRTVSAPAGIAYHVDVIDTWRMTIERLDGTYEGTFTVPLPARQYLALRLVAVPAP